MSGPLKVVVVVRQDPGEDPQERGVVVRRDDDLALVDTSASGSDEIAETDTAGVTVLIL